MVGLAKTQSCGIGYGLVPPPFGADPLPCSCRVETGFAEASVLQLPTTWCQIERVTLSSKGLEVHILPAQREEFADAKPGCRIQENQCPFSNVEIAEKKLQLRKVPNTSGASFPLRTLPHELDRVGIQPTRIALRD